MVLTMDALQFFSGEIPGKYTCFWDFRAQRLLVSLCVQWELVLINFLWIHCSPFRLVRLTLSSVR